MKDLLTLLARLPRRLEAFIRPARRRNRGALPALPEPALSRNLLSGLLISGSLTPIRVPARVRRRR